MAVFQTLTIVIPVYNEEETLEYSFNRLCAIVPKLNQKIDFIFVNDGSADQTQKILEKIKGQSGQSDFKVEVIQFSRNFGHSAAVLAGLEAAAGDLTAIVDADLQDPPELIPEMVNRLVIENVDVVYGKRTSRSGEGVGKRFTAWAFYRFINVMTGVRIPQDTGDFRVMTAEVRTAVLRCHEQDPFLRGLVAWVGFRQVPFEYLRENRKYGITKYPLLKMVRFAVMAVTSFSLKPLYLAISLGIFGIIGSTVISLWTWIVWFEGKSVPGWASLLMTFSLFQSLTILLIGVHGVYMGKVYLETANRPRYIVRKS